MPIAALYIDPRGPYPTLLGPELCWDAERDARTYGGPWPIVAHPPCGPWSKLAFVCTMQTHDLGPIAVDQVRRFGGVLEHPAGSDLFRFCSMPRPGEFPDQFGGRTIEVEQVDWGHVARKRTWLYLVGVHELGESPPSREPTHWCSGFRSSTHEMPSNYRRQGSAAPPGIKIASAQQRRRTPVDFARWLISLAEQANEYRTVSATR